MLVVLGACDISTTPESQRRAGYMIPSQVQEREVTPRLIHSIRVAVVAFLLTGFVAGLTIRNVFFRPAHHHRWLFPVFFALPGWTFLSLQLAFYGYLLWLCFVFFRIARGKERVIVVCWFFNILLNPIDTFFPKRVVIVLDHVQVFGMAVAFFAALDILLRRLVRHEAHP
jgi:hypothetical protein